MRRLFNLFVFFFYTLQSAHLFLLLLQVIATSFFLYFACIAPAVTFGAIYGKATNNYIGTVEMILATAWCGIVYSLIGGQPMSKYIC